MVDTIGREYVFRDRDPQDLIDSLDRSAREKLLRHALNQCDLTEPTTVRLVKSKEQVALHSWSVRYRLELCRVQTMEAVMLVPRETEYDRSLWAIARERLGVRWRRMKRWFYGRSN